jgi:hypothetical protein
MFYEGDHCFGMLTILHILDRERSLPAPRDILEIELGDRVVKEFMKLSSLYRPDPRKAAMPLHADVGENPNWPDVPVDALTMAKRDEVQTPTEP